MIAGRGDVRVGSRGAGEAWGFVSVIAGAAMPVALDAAELKTRDWRRTSIVRERKEILE